MFSRKMRRESKAKLEHKLYLAKETPEPIFDLSDCDIKEVPQGIYSLCRVFLKERLSLESNCLSSLSGGGILSELRFLKILNISHNNFITLPESIGTLTSLQVSAFLFIIMIAYSNATRFFETMKNIQNWLSGQSKN